MPRDEIALFGVKIQQKIPRFNIDQFPLLQKYTKQTNNLGHSQQTTHRRRRIWTHWNTYCCCVFSPWHVTAYTSTWGRPRRNVSLKKYLMKRWWQGNIGHSCMMKIHQHIFLHLLVSVCMSRWVPYLVVCVCVCVVTGKYRTQLYDEDTSTYLPASPGIGMHVEVSPLACWK